LITREELRKALWASDTFVDFEHGVNAAVMKLRQVLSDDAEKPRYIETMPRRGYRFIFEVNVPVEPTVDVPTEVRRNTNLLKFLPKMVVWAVVAVSCVLATVFIYQKSRLRLKPSAMRIGPFTSYPGFELCPAFSPDGSRIVFAWNRDYTLGYRDFDLYVKVIGFAIDRSTFPWPLCHVVTGRHPDCIHPIFRSARRCGEYASCARSRGTGKGVTVNPPRRGNFHAAGLVA
jgi:hypothetical protein